MQTLNRFHFFCRCTEQNLWIFPSLIHTHTYIYNKDKIAKYVNISWSFQVVYKITGTREYIWQNKLCSCAPLLYNLQCEVQQLSFALLSSLDHLQDCDGSAQVPTQFQHLLIRSFVVLTILWRRIMRELILLSFHKRSQFIEHCPLTFRVCIFSVLRLKATYESLVLEPSRFSCLTTGMRELIWHAFLFLLQYSYTSFINSSSSFNKSLASCRDTGWEKERIIHIKLVLNNITE